MWRRSTDVVRVVPFLAMAGQSMTERKRRGRPKAPNPATEIIRVRVTPAQRMELRRVASDNGTGMSGIIREAVNEFCSDYGESHPFRRNRK